MLLINVPKTDLWDEASETFTPVKAHTLQLEHSLISLSKWESKWHKSFINTSDKTDEEVLDYIKCMTMTKDVDQNVYRCLTQSNIKEIVDYMNNPMTASTVSDNKNNKVNREIITSELIYYWMITFNIPVEFQKWHINRLMMLIKICGAKNEPPKKMTAQERKALNNARRKRLNSRG